MLTNYDVKSVQHLIDQSDNKERDFLHAHAKMEIDIISNHCLDRVLTDKEQRAYEFALETINQLKARRQRAEASLLMSGSLN